jgi:ABC-type transporter Mla subunit MlaD
MANPVLVGAVTTLVVVVAVFLAYNANSGLPFVPTRQLNVLVSNGANLLPGNEVREGGYRIGIVDDMKPVRLPDGTTGAEVVLKLDKAAGLLPRDSTVSLRPRSVLGLKYVEVKRGRATETFRDGDTLPATQTRFPVELDQLYSIFDERTRNASRQNLKGFGNTFARRGASLNDAIAAAPRFLGHLEPVARTLAAPTNDLGRFFRELGDAARIVAPVAQRYAHGFAAAADTFEAWSRDPEALKSTISKSAPTLDAGIRSLRIQRPFLTDFAAMSRSLERATARLPRVLPRIVPALETGARVQRRAADLNRRLADVMRSMRLLMEDPATKVSLIGLQDTTQILNPLLRFVGPYITVCNYFNYAWTHAGEHLTEPDPTGTSQRTLLNQGPRTVNQTDPQLASIGARTPANGEAVLTGVPVHLHTNVYSAAVDRAGNADCESGQRGYVKRAAHFVDKSRTIVVDPHIPGNQGPTFTGLPKVPVGQTFTRAPQTGPQMPPELDP